MPLKGIIKKTGEKYDSLNEMVGAAFVEIVIKNENKTETLFEKVYDENVPVIRFLELEKKDEFQKLNSEEKAISLELDSAEKRINLYIFPSPAQSNHKIYAVFQKESPFDDTGVKLLSFFSEILSLVEETSESGKNEKYKKELINMRNMQAKLFPKFDDANGLDIAGVYLPFELMSGNFIDAFRLSDDVYQIVACDVSGYDASSSFIGAAVRTLVKAMSSEKIVSSALIEIIVTRLNKMISGIRALVYLTIYQINTRTGQTKISSYGDITTILYRAKKGKSLSLKDSRIGMDLAKRNTYKDITLVLDPGDCLLFYSKGVINVSTEDGRSVYTEQRLIDKYMEYSDSSSMEMIHSVIDSLYEFSNYSGITDDILMVGLKKR